MNYIDDIKRLLEADRFKPVAYGRGAASNEIEMAERECGLTFPKSYKEFLLHLGWIDCPFITVCGLGSDADWRTNLMAIVQSWWHEVDADIRLPRNLIPVVDDGSGNVYCLDVSQMQESECPVVFWDHESFEGAEQVPVRVGSDFYSWLVNEIAELSS